MLVLTLREAKSRLPIFLICHPIQNHILLVGANGCSPEEGEALSQAQGRRLKEPSCLRRPVRLRLPSLAFGEGSSRYAGRKNRFTLNAAKTEICWP